MTDPEVLIQPQELAAELAESCELALVAGQHTQGVQQRGHQSAVDDAKRVVDRFIDRTTDLDPSLLEVDEVHLQQADHRRRREVAVPDRAEHVPSGAPPRRSEDD